MSVEAVVSTVQVQPKPDLQNQYGQARREQPRKAVHRESHTDEPDAHSFLNAYGELIGKIINIAA